MVFFCLCILIMHMFSEPGTWSGPCSFWILISLDLPKPNIWHTGLPEYDDLLIFTSLVYYLPCDSERLCSTFWFWYSDLVGIFGNFFFIFFGSPFWLPIAQLDTTCFSLIHMLQPVPLWGLCFFLNPDTNHHIISWRYPSTNAHIYIYMPWKDYCWIWSTP